MTSIRRFGAVCAVLAVTGITTHTSVWGDSGKKPREQPVASGSKSAPGTPERDLKDELANTKFSRGGVVTYKTKDGDVLIAVQVKPKLEGAPDRPRDYLVMLDTSASQAGEALAVGEKIAGELAISLRPEDRVSLWTINIPAATRDLTRGFQSAKSAAVDKALQVLKEQVPLGDTDLKGGLAKAISAFKESERGRQRVLLFLGDGMSIHNPVSPDDRAKLSEDMVKNEIAFFSVPLGPRLDPQNLHGFASATGGQILRTLARESVSDYLTRLHKTVAAPILYPTSMDMPAELPEYLPTRLPPLRSDVPSLLIGRIKPDAKTLNFTVKGTVAGQEVTATIAEPITEPELDNFFLVGIFEQWKNAKDQPALMHADRALAFAHETNQMLRADMLAQGDMALASDKLDVALNLYNQVLRLDPSDVAAAGGIKIVEKLRGGKISKEQLVKQLGKREGMGVRIGKDEKGAVQIRRDQLDKLVAQADAVKDEAKEKVPPPVPGDAGPGVDDAELLRRQQLRLAVEEQKVNQAVEDAVRQARRILATDPDGAHDLLKRTLSAIRDNPDLTDKTRQLLNNQLENALRNVDTRGAIIRRDQQERLQTQAIALAHAAIDESRRVNEDRTRERFRVYHNLMNEARYEDAYKQSLAIGQDATNQGRAVPVAVTAAYDVGINATNLREVQELVRVRQERYLLTMMQCEKSAIPFPDEPPVQFPPAATWREITRLRKEKYENSGFTDDNPVTLAKIKELERKLATPITIEFEANTPLKEALGHISERYNVTILVDTEAFKADLMIQEVENLPVKLPKMVGVSLGTVLRLLLAQVQGTYMIRREFIEVTTGQRQASERTLRVYPVADLVIPIPNSSNQQQINQTIQNTILGGSFSPFSGTIGGQVGIGGVGGFAGIGGIGGFAGIGGIGGLGGGIGGLGGGFGGGGAMGLPAGGLLGGGAGPQNLGVGGGGLLGFAGIGGQLGQFGNLGGQFGLQGGDQSLLLITLIRQVVGEPKDWSPLGAFQKIQGGGGPAGQAGIQDEEPGIGDPNQSGAVGYYPPSRALVVKGTSRVHTRIGGGLLAPRPPQPGDMKGALDLERPGAVVIKPGDNANNKAVASNDKKDAKDPKKIAGPAKPATELANLDPKKIWQEALGKANAEPGLIIAVADFLAQTGKWDHATEFLKANLRQGILVRPWVYEALAVALKESKGSLEDIERAQLSSVDLEPRDARGYLQASKAMADNKLYDRAVVFCQQAALLSPNNPDVYSDALLYAEMGKDRNAMEWAAGNLLGKDWPKENDKFHNQANQKLDALAKLLQSAKRQDEATQMTTMVSRKRQRDLFLELTWQGEADLDLEVKEPIGTTCSFLHRQTLGGGILIGDTLDNTTRETYVAAEAFAGDYEVAIRRVWGRPLGGKATLKIIQHQGTPQQTERWETIKIDDSRISPLVKLRLAEGRRTRTERISSIPSPTKPEAEKAKADSGDRILNKLRALADPDLSDADTTRMKGSVGSQFYDARLDSRLQDSASIEQIAYASKVEPFGVNNKVDMIAQASVSADRRYVRMSLAPVFQTVTNTVEIPVVSFIPGAWGFGR